MRLLLLPISTRRTLIYCQRLNIATAEQKGWGSWGIAKAEKLWTDWEQKDSGWQKWVVDNGNKALKRIPYEEWALKSIPPLSARRRAEEPRGKEMVELSFPAQFIPHESVMGLLRKLGTERQSLHKQRIVYSIIGMPLVAPFALVPVVPNLPFFYLVYRAWSHWKALAGSKHLEFLLNNKLIEATPSKILDDLYSSAQRPCDAVADGADGVKVEERMLLHQSDGKKIGEGLGIPELEIELERAVWQVEKALQSDKEKELKQEPRHLRRANADPQEKKGDSSTSFTGTLEKELPSSQPHAPPAIPHSSARTMPQDLNDGDEDDDDDDDDPDQDVHGDSIAVPGQYAWAPPPSTPESMSADIDVTTLLAQHTPRHLESPEPFEGDLLPRDPPPDIVPGPDSRPGTKQRPRLAAHTMEERLMAMPPVRELPWREGVEAGADNETGGESRRKQIRFGCLLATRGEIKENPCVSCANGRGKFSVCVALDGYFKGACASCQLSGRPNRCSIKKNEVGAVAGSPTLNPPLPEDLSPYVANGHLPPSDSPDAKRRKTDAIPEWESARPQWEQELGESHARQQMNEIVQRPWASVNPPAPMPDAHGMMNGLTGSGSRPAGGGHQHRDSLSWGAVSQAVAMPGQSFGNGADGGGQTYRLHLDPGRREDTGYEDGVALIDTLPKTKQRQVYGLISGIQGGILTLQRELDSLKRALGIDDEI